MIQGGQTTAATAQERKIIRAALRVVRRALKKKQTSKVVKQVVPGSTVTIEL